MILNMDKIQFESRAEIGTIINEYLNPLRIVEATNMDLELEDIICAGWNRKGKSSDTGYTIYKIDHYWIGLKFADKITA